MNSQKHFDLLPFRDCLGSREIEEAMVVARCRPGRCSASSHGDGWWVLGDNTADRVERYILLLAMLKILNAKVMASAAVITETRNRSQASLRASRAGSVIASSRANLDCGRVMAIISKVRTSGYVPKHKVIGRCDLAMRILKSLKYEGCIAKRRMEAS